MRTLIKLYYNNVTADVIGNENGITGKQLSQLAEKTKPLIGRINEQRKQGKTPYRDLPYDEQTPAKIKKLA